MTLDIKNMTQTEFDNFMADLKVNNPNLFQFIVDFINKKVTVQEVEAFQKMEPEVQQLYIKNYKARAQHERTRFNQHTGGYIFSDTDWLADLFKPSRPQKKRSS